ncbi:hypothetical protein EOPP23_14755 [Endozoicomonas sp. OPT23]|uniref:hypothetical protein n=1 Tax=Endozoicomonas sp. OPT23 TaxID=2072845 RepID=UPI00129A4A8B|nr:hypothetical protein [Endozoicomonas sp. OPT23]MRI34252.1 hypothetical protein [Endozoicomonas sp. OPT23]
MNNWVKKGFTSPLFFNCPELALELWGIAKGTEIFTKISDLTGVKVQPTEKTLRKLLNEPWNATDTSANKLLKFYRKAFTKLGASDEDIKVFIEGKKEWTARNGAWRSILFGFRRQYGARFFPNTLALVEQLLNKEHIAFIEGRSNCPVDLATAKFTQTEYYKKYALPLTGLDSFETVSKHTDIDNIVDDIEANVEFKHSVFHGGISLQMDILACLEVEWLANSDSCHLTGTKHQSAIVDILPEFREGNIIWPLDKLLLRWRTECGLTTWQAMAAVIAKEKTVSDKERDDETHHEYTLRQIHDLRAKHRIAKDEVVMDWLKKLCEAGGLYYSEQANLGLYRVASFMTRLLRDCEADQKRSENPDKELSPQQLIAAFETYKLHFKHHLSAAEK